MKISTSLSTVAICILFSVACGNRKVSAASGLQMARATQFASSIPQVLSEIESLAEDAYDKALADDITGVHATATLISTKWQSFRSQLISDGGPPADIQSLDAAVPGLLDTVSQSNDKVQIARAANAVSASMANVYSIYHPAVPPALMELDFLGRELVLDGMASDFVRAPSDQNSLSQSWADLRPQIVSVAGGSRLANSYDLTLSRLRSAIANANNSSLIAAANDSLDQVDQIEQLF